jgi:uncharacterized protein (DUF362 family)
METRSEVAIGVKKSPGESLHAALSKLSEPIVPPKNTKRVVIKPSIYNPKLPGNTDAELVRALIHMFRSIGPISIVESDNPLRRTEEAFFQCQYTKLTDERVEFVNLSDAEMASVKFPGHYFKNREMPRVLHDDAFIINAATLKAEPDICDVGAGIKNLFGLLPEQDKSVYHPFIDDVLMDLLSLYRPNLTVIDLTDVIIGGRENHRTEHLGGVIVGIDPVSVDSFCSSLLGFNSLEVNHLRMGHELGYGEALIDRIRVRGTDYQVNRLLEFFKKWDIKKGFIIS